VIEEKKERKKERKKEGKVEVMGDVNRGRRPIVSCFSDAPSAASVPSDSLSVWP
jgi:hypothetical protein